jgi:hypothetical protein
MPLKPSHVDGGYFCVLEVTDECKAQIPAKYFELGNYEPKAENPVL